MIFHFDPTEEGRKKAASILESLSQWANGYTVEVKRNRPIRSLSSNRYYWGGILKTIAIHTGEDKDRLHELFKLMFNYVERNFKNGMTMRQPESTSNLDDKEFKLYCDKVKQFATNEWGVIFIDERNYDTYSEDAINEQYSNVFDRV